MNSKSLIYEGYVDFTGATLVSGWARNVSQPNERLDIDILVDDQPFTTIRADQLRQDLIDAGKGDGRCAFIFQIPEGQLRDGKTHSIHVKISGTDVSLANTPKDVFCPYDVSEPLPRQVMEDVARVALGRSPL